MPVETEELVIIVCRREPDSVARWWFSPPDLENSIGFESRLAGKKYFWRTPNFWQISGGFDQFCIFFFLVDLADFGGCGVSISKKQI
jgi:hypothetical protein